MGGPDGGDGGKGGDIILVGDNSKNTLLDLSFKQHQHAENGKNGGGSDKHGRNGKDLRIHVPLGTVAKLDETGEVLQEVIEKKEYLVFSGGRGGRGRRRFRWESRFQLEAHNQRLSPARKLPLPPPSGGLAAKLPARAAKPSPRQPLFLPPCPIRSLRQNYFGPKGAE